MKEYFFGANWKMNFSYQEAKDFFSQWHSEHIAKNTTVTFFPTQHLLAALHAEYGAQHHFGAQNVCGYPKGAYTGEITAELLSQDHIGYALIGHSERRTLFHEEDKDIQLKLIQNLKYNIISVLCVGESLQVRENGQHLLFIEEQIKNSLGSITDQILSTVILAYEPIWAIGTGKTASVEQIQEVHSFIKEIIDNLSAKPGCSMRVIYGGSVNTSNAREILSLPDVDGALIGGASLKPKELLSIVESIH